MSEDNHLHLASLNINQKKLDETLKHSIRKINALVKEDLMEVKFNYNQKHKYEKPEGNLIINGLENLDNKLIELRWELQNLLNSSRFNGKPVVDVVEALNAETTNSKVLITPCDAEEASVLNQASEEAKVIDLKEVSLYGR